jgi:hypothetical protein
MFNRLPFWKNLYIYEFIMLYICASHSTFERNADFRDNLNGHYATGSYPLSYVLIYY